MKDMWNWIQAAWAVIGGGLGYLLGGYDGFVYALIFFVVTDYLTGIMCAVIDRKLSSEIGFKGIFKKICIFCLVALGNIVDTYLIGNGSALRTAVIFFYISNEGISLLENAGRIGIPIPGKLQDVLAQLQSKEDK